MVGLVAVVLLAGYLVTGRSGGGRSDSGQASADERTTPSSTVSTTASPTTNPAATSTASGNPGATPVGRYDLSRDEERGGHTLARHVGKTDAELRNRLQTERDISAASTYTDRTTAEETVAAALARNDAKVRDWTRGSNHANLAIRVTMPSVVGRSLKRGANSAVSVKSAVVVLRWAGSSWYVLTSYPEDR